MSNNLYYGYTKSVHELAEKYIQRDILSNCTSLVNHLITSNILEIKPNNEFTNAHIHNLYESARMVIESYYDPENLLNNYELSSLTDIENLHDELWEVDNPTAKQSSLMDCLKELIKQIEEPDLQEIFEWYEITKWLAEKLIEKGEPILENDYGFYWGRTCTGQSIILDGTVQQVAKDYI
ncbi:MAG: hypothetical protein AB8G86_04820 [Saprospiraceae bacterium]